MTMENLGNKGSSNGQSTGKCPFMHGGSTSPDTSPLKWWPKRLNLDILHQHDEKTNPYNKEFNYRDEVKSLDFKALEKDMALYPDLPKNWQKYYGEITAMDRALGNLRTGLKNKGLDENTLIWYTSDNGSYRPVETITGLRGSKGMMYEGGIRVPALIVWPGHIRKPLETEMRGTTLDMMPTLLDLLGITLKNRELDGMSLLPLLQGKRQCLGYKSFE